MGQLRGAAGAPKARILLVEDRALNVGLAQGILESAGYEVAVAGNGAEACVAVDNNNFDLVLMDLTMPVMDGYAATAAIRRRLDRKRTMLIVAFTARDSPEIDRACRNAGMDGRMTKPRAPADLLRQVQEWLQNPEHRARDPVWERRDYNEVVRRLGADRVRPLLLGFETRLVAISEAIRTQSIETTALINEAHSLVSLAGTLGFDTLRHASFDVMSAGKDPSADLRSALVMAIDEALQALGGEYAETLDDAFGKH